MTNESSHKKDGFVSGFLKWLPAIQWAFTLITALTVFGLSQREAQTAQSSEIMRIISEQKAIRDQMNEHKTEREKQITDLRESVLTKEVFEAYHSNDVQRMERMEKMLEQILQK